MLHGLHHIFEIFLMERTFVKQNLFQYLFCVLSKYMFELLKLSKLETSVMLSFKRNNINRYRILTKHIMVII